MMALEYFYCSQKGKPTLQGANGGWSSLWHGPNRLTFARLQAEQEQKEIKRIWKIEGSCTGINTDKFRVQATGRGM